MKLFLRHFIGGLFRGSIIGLGIRAMPTSIVATIAFFQVISFRKYHQPIFHVKMLRS